MTSNSNIDEAVQKAVDNLFDILEQAIQQELLKARIETLEWLLEQEVEFGGLELKQSIIDKVAELQKELKENSDDKTI